MAIASYPKKIKVSADGSNWVEIEASSANVSNSADILDVTNMATNEGWREKIQGLHDWNSSIEAFYSNNNDAITIIKNSFNNRTDIYLQYLPTGDENIGFQGQCIVESMDIAGPVDAAETFNVSLQGKGQLTII